MARRPLPSEFDLIAKFFAPIAKTFPGALGLRDDAAVFDPPPGKRIVATMDAIVAGVHFLAHDPPDSIARKLMRVNLSDLAAKGATPYACLMTLCLPHGIDEAWIASFTQGLARDASAFKMPLIGGDTTTTPGPLTLSLAALGLVEAGQGPILRAGARVGDTVYVTGTIGDAGLGLMVLNGEIIGLAEEHRAALIDRYRLPQPRVALGRRLLGIANGSADVSDGLVADLGHVCRASNVAAELQAARLPLSPAAAAAVAREPDLRSKLFASGDDYEIVFTAAPEAAERLAALATDTGIAVTAVGRIVEGQGVTVRDEAGHALPAAAGGYRHF